MEALRAPGAAAPSLPEVEAALARALRFLRGAGDPVALQHAEALLGLRPVREVEAALAPAVTAAEAKRDAHRVVVLFRQLAALRALRGRVAAALARAAETLQRPDGSWRADGDASETDAAGPAAALPPFLRGASDPIYLTAMIAGSLALTSHPCPAALAPAGAWIAERWRPELVQGGAWHGLVSLFHFFASGEHELADEALQWCGRELERAFRARAIGAVATGEVFLLCAATALPGARLAAGEVARAILDEQAADGGWREAAAAHSARGGATSAPAETARAVAVLLHLVAPRPGTLAIA